MLEQLTEFRNVHSLACQFIIKAVTWEQSDGKGVWGEVEKGHPRSPCAHPRGSLNPVLFGFMEASSRQHD